MNKDELESLKREVFNASKYVMANKMLNEGNLTIAGVISETIDHLAPRIVREGWQPIETAPKDGKPILGVVDGDVGEISWWNGTYKQHWIFTFDDEYESVKPTHWMPLPQPPASKGD